MILIHFVKIILFQGDSITDCGRDKNKLEALGNGYPNMVSGALGAEYPYAYKFINKGISGNRVVDLYARIKCDLINLKPDYMSILIGINDVWHELGSQNGVSAEKFEKIYSMLIEEIKEELPEIKIFILEPFVAHGPATDDNFEYFVTETKLRAEAAKRIAEKYDLTFVPLQNVFDEAITKAPASYWTHDGVHPNAEGHGLIARELTKAVL